MDISKVTRMSLSRKSGWASMIDFGSDMPVIAKRCTALMKIAAFVNMKSVKT